MAFLKSGLFKNLSLPDDFPSHSYHYEGNFADVFNSTKSALCIVDMQRFYCDPTLRGNSATEAIRAPISDLKRSFNERGLPVYVIYMDHGRYGIHKSCGGLYGIEVNPDLDIAVAKDADSAFMASRWCDEKHIAALLEEQGVETLVLAGVNFSVCVERTASDAVKSFNTFVVGDYTANGQTRGYHSARETVAALDRRGVGFVTGQQVLEAVRREDTFGQHSEYAVAV